MTGQDYRLISPDQVTPHPANPRRGNLPAIVESVRNHGLYGAVVVQASTGHVIVGNHRVLAARQLGLPEIPAAFLDVDDDEALRILANDNRTSDLGGYDNQSLTALLAALDATERRLDGTGYGPDDLPDLPSVDTADLLADTADGYREQYGVIAICADEAGQQQTYEKLRDLGYNCRVVTT